MLAGRGRQRDREQRIKTATGDVGPGLAPVLCFQQDTALTGDIPFTRIAKVHCHQEEVLKVEWGNPLLERVFFAEVWPRILGQVEHIFLLLPGFAAVAGVEDSAELAYYPPFSVISEGNAIQRHITPQG